MTSQSEILIRLLLGAALGGIIGYERERHGRPAGFRTNMVVCIASVLIMFISINFFHLIEQLNISYVRIDPGRIAAGAITGIGFLGAGVIVRSGATVRGLTTAAVIWMVSIIGLTVGAGMYYAAILATAVTMASLATLRVVERRIRGDIYRDLLVVAESRPGFQEELDSIVRIEGVTVLSVDYELDAEEGEVRLDYVLRSKDEGVMKDIAERLYSRPGVKRVKLGTRDR